MCFATLPQLAQKPAPGRAEHNAGARFGPKPLTWLEASDSRYRGLGRSDVIGDATVGQLAAST